MDWISSFVSATNELPSSVRHRLWAGILTVAGVLERRVWAPSRLGSLFPNLYVFLDGPSGSGKTTAIIQTRNIWARIKEVRLSPDNVSNASFYDALGETFKMNGFLNGTSEPYSAMAVPCLEMGVLFPRYEIGFLSDLSSIYDNPPIFDSKRRISKSVKIEAPTVNLLVAATPDTLCEILPEIAWGQGFCARIIHVFSEKPFLKNVDLTKPAPIVNELPSLASELENLTQLSGEFIWSQPAFHALHLWYKDGEQDDMPLHSRLNEYNTRRDIHVMKLSMISSASNGHFPEIKLEDFDRALTWLTSVEKLMPDLFSSMAQGPDSRVLKDLAHFVLISYNRKPLGQRIPVSTSELWNFLKEHTEAWKIKGLIEAAENSGLITKGGYIEEWLPGKVIPIHGNRSLFQKSRE